MEKDITICFQTTSEISNAVEKIAKEQRQTVSSVIESIIYYNLKDNKAFKGIHQNRRRLTRTKIRLLKPCFSEESGVLCFKGICPEFGKEGHW